MWKNIAAIHSIFLKKITKQKFKPGQYLKGKINKNNFGKKINKKKKKIRNLKKNNFAKKTKKKEKKEKLAKKKEEEKHCRLLL